MAEPVVNFSDLSTDKKQEFLQFLVSNNIKFQEGTDNYIAKVTLGGAKRDKENRQPLSPAKKTQSCKQQQCTPTSTKKLTTSQQSHQQTKVLQPLSTNVAYQGSGTKPVEKTASPSKCKPTSKGHARQHTLTINNNPPSQRSSLPHQPDPRVKKEVTRNRSKSANSRHKQHSPLAVVEPTKQPRSPEPKPHAKTNISLQFLRSATSVRPTRQVSMSHSVQSHPVQPTQPVARQPQHPLYPPELLGELLSILRVPNLNARPTRLPRAQVLKIIEEVYSSNFARNNQLLKHRKFKEAYHHGTCVFSNYVVEHFDERYKTQRLCHSHLLNLVHSLLSYLHEPDPSSSLKLFYRFLLEDYEYQELVFFLFVRSVFEKEFGQNLQKAMGQPHRSQEHHLNRREITRLVRAIFGRDSQEIVTEYQQMVFMQMAESIPLYDLFTLMLIDYQSKRKIKNQQGQMSHVETNATVSPTNQQQEEERSRNRRVRIQEPPSAEQSLPSAFVNHSKSSKCSLFHENNSSNYEELTFGECSTSNRVDEEDQTEFWNDFESLRAPEDDGLFRELEHKLKRKVSELVQIMLGDEESLWTDPAKQLGRLILGKSMRMLEAVFAMDKIKWFRLLRVHRPQSCHLEVVEALQLMLRNIRKKREHQADQEEYRQLESDFCKSLLTVEQLKRAIERIVIG